MDQLHIIMKTQGDLIPHHVEVFHQNAYYGGRSLKLPDRRVSHTRTQTLHNHLHLASHNICAVHVPKSHSRLHHFACHSNLSNFGKKNISSQ